jgi:hypothetical protein
MIGLETPLALLVAAPLLVLWWRFARGPRSVWPIRIAVLLLASLALASPVIRSGGGRHIVFLVDRSLSVGTDAVNAAAEMLDHVQSRGRRGDRVSTVLFGDGAVVLSSGEDPAAGLKGTALDDASDLHAGLELAGRVAGRGGRVCVVSDGRHTGDDPHTCIARLRSDGVAVDYWPVENDPTRDAAITQVALPERVRVGEPFSVAVEVYSPVSADAALRVDAGTVRLRRTVRLRPGRNRYTFSHALSEPGLASFRLAASVKGDPRPQNNTARAVTQAAGAGGVLVVNRSGEPDRLSKSLASAGLPVTVHGPGESITSAGIKHFRAVVLENVALGALGDRSDAALRNAATELGVGLLVTGGENSFAMGGYYRSELEAALPVSLERADTYRRRAVALAIVLDKSASMTAPVGDGLDKMDLANRAAAEAVALLKPSDEVAVIAVNSLADRVVTRTRVGSDRAGIRTRILATRPMGGGVFVKTGLDAAIAELRESPCRTRHAVLFADADDCEDTKGCDVLVREWTRAGGTLSVIGLGTDRSFDAELLEDLAEAGNGTVSFTQDPMALPRVFCQEAMRVARRTFHEDPTPTRVTRELARFATMKRFPAIGGYNLCETRAGASEMVVTADANRAPVLAAWRSGRGRVAALTAEVDGAFTGELSDWPQFGAFFASLVTWLQRGDDDPGLFGTIVRNGREAEIRLELDESEARTCTKAVALIVSPDERGMLLRPLEWDSPQSMRATFRLEKNGVYHGVVLTRHAGDGEADAAAMRRATLPPVVLPYSPEFELRPGGSGAETLAAIAAATGGRRVMHVRDLFAPSAEAGARAGADGETGDRHLVPLLAALALALVVCDVITRRSLWRHVIRQSVRARAAAAGARVMAIPDAVRERHKQEPRDQPPGPAPTEPPPNAPPPRGTVFDRAKRRAEW